MNGPKLKVLFMKKSFLALLLLLVFSIVPAWADVRGDVNGDGAVSPADISALIDYLLGSDTGASAQSADVNNSGSVGPEDISALIDYLLGSGWPDEPAGEVITVGGVSFTMVTVDGGTFMMGATEEQQTAIEDADDEFPVHQVTLSGFLIGQTQVTQELWLAVMGSNPSVCNGDAGYHDFGENLQRPVDNVSWNDCQTFIGKLNEMTGKTFRLPTEAEWEFAARGGNMSGHYMYAGSDSLDEVAWYEGNALNDSRSPDYGSHAVATKAPNELGLYDMSGNVFEWCNDAFAYYSSAPQTNPQGPSWGLDRVCRGGGFNGSEGTCRLACRWGGRASDKDWGFGLRLAADDPACTAMPEVSTRLTDSALVITATGEGTVTLIVDGEAVANPYTAMRGSEPRYLKVQATAQASGKKKTQCGETTVTVRPLDTPPVTETFTVGGVTFEMVSVEGGTFMMGAGEEQPECNANERPVHQVTLSGFAIGQTEVTQELWVAVMGSNPTNFRGNLQRPVDCVSWNDCQAFIAKLNELTGKTFRLPTEAEWEFAARGGNKSLGFMYAGSDNVTDVAWYFDNSGWQPHAVATLAPNELGIYDMSGNLDEWCNDWYKTYGSAAQTDPQGPATGTYRVCRGGGWSANPLSARVTVRGSINPGTRTTDVGFRLAL